jgi:drug/metabolite transporter (DMT)-like permease
MDRTLRGVAYVSVWVLFWGTASSLADFVLLEREAYNIGSTGQAITFVSYGIATVVLAVRLAGRFLKTDEP